METVIQGAPMDMTDACYRIAVEQRIRELWARRAWYRNHPGWIVAHHVEDRHELRALVRIARAARKGAAMANRRDYDRQVVQYTETELRYAWGDR